jgi:hypothetical protein
MQTSTPTSSLTTLTAADTRIRQLGATMFELNSRGDCTRDLLRAEGFSTHELDTYGDAARAYANTLFVRDDDAPAQGFTRTDAEVVAIAVGVGMGLLGDARIVNAMLGTGLGPREIERNWPAITRKLGMKIGTLRAPKLEVA